MFTAVRVVAARVRAFLRRDQEDGDFGQELETHVSLLEERMIRQGMTPEQARRAARVELGGQVQLQEAHRQTRGLPLVESLLRDLRYAVRTLRRDAALTTFAILIVGLGVGAGATVFSVVNALLLRPLPFEDPGRLVWIANGESDNLSAQTVQVDNLVDLREQGQSFSGVAGFDPFYGVGDVRLTGRGEPERLTGVPVTEGFFPLLGIQPQLGRLFTAEECRWNGPKVVLLSHSFWQRRLTADPAVIGRSITLDGTPATVVGVLPASFDFAATFTPGSSADLFVPFPLSPETNQRGNTLALIGRLKPGTDVRMAQAESTLIAERIRRSLPEGVRRNGFEPRLSTLQERVSGRFRHALLVLFAAVGVLMLLVCANLSNLLLARGSARQHEMAVRAALGAGRGRLIRQMLVESFALSCGGAALGLALASAATPVLADLQSTSSIPLIKDVRVDGMVAAFTVLMAMVTGVAFGLLPALQVSGRTPHGALKVRSRGSIGGSGDWARRAIVVAQVVLVCVLLTAASLLVRSLARVLDVEPGFRSENVIAVRVDPGGSDLTVERRNAYFDEIVHHVRSVPGVEAVGLTDALPLGDNFGWRTWDASATPAVQPDQRQFPLIRMIDEGYFAAMKIGLRAGRGFTLADGPSSDSVVIVNDTLARTFWPGQDPVGRTVWTSNGRVARRVIGVVGDVRYFGLERGTGAEMYMPLRQTGNYKVVDLVVMGTIPPASLAPGIRAALNRVDANLPTTDFRTMQQLVNESTFARRFVMLLIVGFAGFGLIVALLGIYAVISYSVSQRTQEIGIRMALGASPGEVQTRILIQTLRLALIGLAAGVPVSWIAARGIQGLLFGVGFSDPVTFAAVPVLLATVAAIAGYLPARRASHIDPIAALRPG